MNARHHRNRKGTSLIESLCGAMFLIPIMLFAVDLSAIVLANQANDHLAKDAARAAANQLTQDKAKEAANKTLNNFNKSNMITALNLDECAYDSSSTGEVTVTTNMTVNLPVPFPGFASRKFVARSVEPIVATPTPM